MAPLVEGMRLATGLPVSFRSLVIQSSLKAVPDLITHRARNLWGVVVRRYDDEKGRVPSWCDRVLWRSLPGGLTLTSTGASDCDDPHFYASDHTPVTTTFEFEIPILPAELPLVHCTLYLSNLSLYRARQRGSCSGASGLSARTQQGKGAPPAEFERDWPLPSAPSPFAPIPSRLIHAIPATAHRRPLGSLHCPQACRSPSPALSCRTCRRS